MQQSTVSLKQEPRQTEHPDDTHAGETLPDDTDVEGLIVRLDNRTLIKVPSQGWRWINFRQDR